MGDLKHQIIVIFDTAIADIKLKTRYNERASKFMKTLPIQEIIRNTVQEYGDAEGDYDEETEMEIMRILIDEFEGIAENYNNEPGAEFLMHLCRPKRVHINPVVHGGWYELPTNNPVISSIVNQAVANTQEGVDMAYLIFPFWLMVPNAVAFRTLVPSLKYPEDITDEDIYNASKLIEKWNEVIHKYILSQQNEAIIDPYEDEFHDDDDDDDSTCTYEEWDYPPDDDD